MVKYVKRPIPVLAKQLKIYNFLEIIVLINEHTHTRFIGIDSIEFKTLEGYVTAYVGDWILIGDFKGEILRVRQDIFERNYEELY